MATAALLSLLATITLAPPAELVVLGGKLITLDEARPRATALAAAGGRIVAVGDDKEVEKWIGPETQVFRLQGELVTPGFIEGHGHFTALGRAQLVLDLSQARDWDEIVQLVSRAAQQAPPGRWIVGRGWHQSKWREPPRGAVEGYPPHDELSAVTPRHPVFLSHASGHLALGNAEAMRRAGVTRDTPDPAGGQIVRNPQGEPIGIFRETAEGLLTASLAAAGDDAGSAEGEAALADDVARASAACLAHGITSFHDAGSPPATVEQFARLAAQGRLPVRLYVMLRGASAELAPQLAALRRVGDADGFLTVRAIKASIDGALGAHGAWLLEPYADLPASRGLNTTSVAEIEQLAELCCQHDYQLCVHAIGDRANRETLDLFARVWDRQAGGRGQRRWRIEHAQHLSPADIPRFAQLEVIASMQAIHATSDAPFVVERLGEQRAREGAYVWRSLWDTGALVTNGTDAPVEAVDPMACFYAAVTRRRLSATAADEPAFFPEQCLTRDEALRSYTVNNARAAYEEQEKGSLSTGKWADFVIWSADFLTIPEERIPGVRPLRTVVGGKVRFTAPEAAPLQSRATGPCQRP